MSDAAKADSYVAAPGSCSLLKKGAGAASKKGSSRGHKGEPTVSQIGGGKAFRQSQIGGKPSNQSALQSGILSGIKVSHSLANLSVIESGDEEESPS